jgi:hypothetical protein
VTNTVTVNNQNGFTGNVTLHVSNPPIGVTASFSTNPTTGTSVVTLSASNSAIAGFYQVSIGGTSGTQSTYITLFLQVNAPPSFTLGASPSCLTLSQGGSVTDTITVTPQTGFTGNVTLGAPNLPSGVTASFGANPTTGSSVLTLTASSPVLPGNYLVIITGSSGAQTVTATLPLSVSVSATTTNLSITPSGGTLTAGTSYTLTAKVSPTSGSLTPTGNIVFTIGSATQTVALNSSGVATYNGTAPAAAGSLALSASFQGTTEFSASASNTLNETVVAIPTAIVLSITPSGGTLIAGTSYTLTATVSPSSGSVTPTGSVIFTIGTSTQTAALNSSGVATYNGTAPAAAGGLTISSAYQGTSTFLASTSNTLNETVLAIPTLAVATSGTPSSYGGFVTFTATISRNLLK